MTEILIRYFASEHKEGVRHMALGTGKVLLLNPGQKVKLTCPKGCLCQVCRNAVPLNPITKTAVDSVPKGFKGVTEAVQLKACSVVELADMELEAVLDE